jgi:putative ABC transport system permease protein
LRLIADLVSGLVADRLGPLLPPREPGRGIRRTRRPLPPFLDAALVDTRIAARALGQHRAFAWTVIVTLGVGIGGVTAMWSVAYDVLLRPLPYPNPERLVRVWNDASLRAGPPARYAVSSSAEIGAWQTNARTIEAVAGLSLTTRTVEGGEYSRRIATGVVTTNFFDVLGGRVALGRGFREEDGRTDANAVAVLSDELWQTEFGADRSVVGRSIRVNGRATEIIGVARPEFRWIDRVEWKGIADVRLWTVRAMDATDHNHFYQVVARMKPGETVERVSLDLGTIMSRVERVPPGEKHPERAEAWVHVEPVTEALFGPVRERVMLPLAAVLLVLLLACANTANLLLSRLPARRSELATRTALGASRTRLVRQLLTESLVLVAAATTFSVFVAYVSVRAIAALGPREITRLDETTVSGVALLASVLIAAICTVIVGLAPAVRGSRVDLTRDLAGARGRAQGSGRQRGRAVLLAAELAVVLVLLVGAALLTRSFTRVMRIDTGMDRERTLVARINLPADGYQEDLGAMTGGGRVVRFLPAWEQFVEELVQRVERDPRVAAASASVSPPLATGMRARRFDPEGADTLAPTRGVRDAYGISTISAGYFQTLGIPLIAGRALNERDRDGAPLVAVVSQSLARKYWPGQSAVGKRFYGFRGTWTGDSLRFQRPLVEIVGVVADAREAGYLREPMPRVYFPLLQARSEAAFASSIRGLQFNVVVRAKQRDVASLESLIQSQVRAMNPRVPVSDVRTLDGMVGEEVRGPRFYAFLLSLFGGFSLVVAMAGVFGVLAFTVSQRTHEIGVRIALGAQASAVVRLVVRQVAVSAVAGVLAGLLLAAGATRFVQALLFEVEPTDPASLTVSIALLLTAACAAAWVPARRAVRVDPVSALRAD